MSDATQDAMLTDLGRRLVSGSLSDPAIQQATEATPNFPILPWVNVVKIGGQSIMDRGRDAVFPVTDEIVANLHRHKMILGTGAGTRARHVYSMAIDLGLPIGVLTVLGTAVAWQNAQMLQYLLAKHGIAFLEPEGFASLPHYLMERGAVICQGMPPYKLWEANPSVGRIPPQRTDTGCFLIAEVFGARKMIYVKDEDGLYTADPKKDPKATHIPRISVQELLARDLDDLIVERAVLELMLSARNVKEIQFVNGLKSGQLTAALDGEPVGTVIFNARVQEMGHESGEAGRPARFLAPDARVTDGQAADCVDRVAGSTDPAEPQRHPDRRVVDRGPRPQGTVAVAR
jgi:molybdenum storage protein